MDLSIATGSFLFDNHTIKLEDCLIDHLGIKMN